MEDDGVEYPRSASSKSQSLVQLGSRLGESEAAQTAAKSMHVDNMSYKSSVKTQDAWTRDREGNTGTSIC